jgi:hypothetical protein
MVMRSGATDGRSVSKCSGKWRDQAVKPPFGLADALVAVHASRLACRKAGKAGVFTPVRESSGESQIRIILQGTLLCIGRQ